MEKRAGAESSAAALHNKKIKKIAGKRSTGRGRALGTGAGGTRWRRCARAAGSGPFLGAGIAIGVPAATLELKRAHGHDFLNRPFTFGTITQRCIRHTLLHLKHLGTGVTFVLIQWHFSTPFQTYILFPDSGPKNREPLQPEVYLPVSLYSRRESNNLTPLTSSVNQHIRSICCRLH